MSQKIRFTHDSSLAVVDHYDEDTDEAIGVNENFLKGETTEWDVLDDHGKTVNVQFGDGSVCYGIPKNLFVVLEENE